MSKILVVGGAGFIGSHVADKLSEQGHKVIIYDIKNSLYIKQNQTMVLGDNHDSEKMRKVLDDGVDYVYNFSSIADIEEAKENLESMIDVNIKGNLKLMTECAEVGIKRYIYSSSIYVFSGHGALYKASKQSAELFIEAFNETKNLDYTIARCGTVYGDRASNWNGFKKIIEGIIFTNKLIYDGSGKEVRSFIHVKDLADHFVSLLDAKYKNKYVTLTGPDEISGFQFVELLQEIFEKDIIDSKIKYKGESRPNHYINTPYKFFPRSSKKLIKDSYIELGQGIIEYANILKDKEE